MYIDKLSSDSNSSSSDDPPKIVIKVPHVGNLVKDP